MTRQAISTQQEEILGTQTVVNADQLRIIQFQGKWFWKVSDNNWGYFIVTQNGNSFVGTLDDVGGNQSYSTTIWTMAIRTF